LRLRYMLTPSGTGGYSQATPTEFTKNIEGVFYKQGSYVISSSYSSRGCFFKWFWITGKRKKQKKELNLYSF
jgi:hypothetical protein